MKHIQDLITEINQKFSELKHTTALNVNYIRLITVFNVKNQVHLSQQQQHHHQNPFLTMIHVTVGTVFHAFVTISTHGLNPVRVQVFGMDERVTGPTVTDQGIACMTFDSVKKRMKRESDHATLSPQEQSKHHVFASISNCAMEAIKYYKQVKELCDAPLIHLLIYLTSYHDIFTEKCAICRKLLHLDSERSGMMAPMRSFVYGKPVHIQCVDSTLN